MPRYNGSDYTRTVARCHTLPRDYARIKLDERASVKGVAIHVTIGTGPRTYSQACEWLAARFASHQVIERTDIHKRKRDGGTFVVASDVPSVLLVIVVAESSPDVFPTLLDERIRPVWALAVDTANVTTRVYQNQKHNG